MRGGARKVAGGKAVFRRERALFSHVMGCDFDRKRVSGVPFGEGGSGRQDGIPMGEGESEERTAPCQGISPWDEPCLVPATRRCELCGGWFCESHFSDRDWHPWIPIAFGCWIRNAQARLRGRRRSL